MVFIPKPNCIHRDNWDGCRVHRTLLTRLFGIRPRCVLMSGYVPRDGVLTCADQVERKRPAPPIGGSAVMPPAKND